MREEFEILDCLWAAKYLISNGKCAVNGVRSRDPSRVCLPGMHIRIFFVVFIVVGCSHTQYLDLNIFGDDYRDKCTRTLQGGGKSGKKTAQLSLCVFKSTCSGLVGGLRWINL